MDSKQISIYLKNDKIENDVLHNASSYEKYIILMNETLQDENRKLQAQIKDNESKISEYEEENENYDNSKRYTKGLLKNFIEIDKLRKKIHDIYDNRNFNNESKLKKLYNYNRLFEYFIILLVAFLWKVEFFENFQLYFYVSTVFMYVYVIEVFFYKMKTPTEYNDKIFETEKEIKKISDSQDFLNEYIDCI
jgi:hypothetical protein